MDSVFFYPDIATKLTGAVSTAARRPDPELISRIRRAYRLSVAKFAGHGESGWRGIADMSSDVHECLMSGSDAALTDMLENPGSTNLFYGFDSLFRGANFQEGALQLLPHYTFDCFVRLAEALSACRIWYPEYGDPFPAARPNAGPDSVEALLQAIDRKIGFKIHLPNPFAGEGGLATERGIAGYRAPHAIYQAWRVRNLAGNPAKAKVLEIGAGLGRNAYYARSFGVSNYTIVDLPTTNVAQALFLGQVLGPDAIWLPGDPVGSRGERIRIVPPQWLHDTRDHFNVVINVDSMTEMDRGHATAYIERISCAQCVFLSINHENNAFAVGELCEQSALVSRTPYWLRKGYVEELFLFRFEWKKWLRRLTQSIRRTVRLRTRLRRLVNAAQRLHSE